MRLLERSNKKGISLIELIVFIVVAGIFVPFSYIAFSSVLKEAASPEVFVKMRFLAERKIEDFTRNPFDGIPIQNAPYSDIPNNPGYMWKWEVKYIKHKMTGGEIQIEDSIDPTAYKKIVVWVKNPKGDEYVVSTIVTKRPLDE